MIDRITFSIDSAFRIIDLLNLSPYEPTDRKFKKSLMEESLTSEGYLILK